MDKGLFDRLLGELEAREKSPGLSTSDLLTLPEPLSGLLNWMVRQAPVAFADVVAFLRGDEARTRLLLADLLDKGLVREIDIHGVTHYRVRLAAKRGRALPSNLWQALDEKVEQGGRSSDEMASLEMQNPLEREMEIARRIQASFLPEELPQVPGWELAARFHPARYVAGDFYDVFPLIQNRRLGLVIGDVCDKGVGAALFMALFRTLIRAFAQQHYTLRWMDVLSEDGPAQHISSGRPVLPSTGTSALKNAIELTNNYIANTHGSTSMFATLFFSVLDPSNGTLLYVNGGHEFPILVNSAGVKEQLKPTGPLVGLIPGARFEIQSVGIEPGDILVAFTDGVTEARNSKDELFGRERLYALMARPVSTAAELLDCIQASVQEHMDGADPSDDIALLAVRRQ